MNQMKCYSMRDVTKRSGLSRTTLLYYENIGLFKASKRTRANYRLYTEEDLIKLDRILLYRSAGIPLKDIINLVSKKQNNLSQGFEIRLHQIKIEILKLQQQQEVLTKLTRENASLDKSTLMSKEVWVSMLRNAGLDDEGMDQWHLEFEKNSPQAHQLFLESLNLSEIEIRNIRKKYS
ncbi:MAG: MerR family transcriptional regulator [Marinicella sp.]